MIVLSNLSKSFQQRQMRVSALNRVSLNVAAGEIVGIIGYSGAGKSTLVRCINLLTRPDEGRVCVNGVDLTDLSEDALRLERQKIGMIFQQFSLMPSRTVYENIRLPMTLSSLTPEQCREKILRLLERVHLSDKAQAYPSELSGGQQQRVAIARALANDPNVLLCDEATSALDPKTTASILALLKELNRDLGLTIVVITHEMSVIKTLCDRVVIMAEGSVVETGAVQEVFLHPKTDLAREFIAQADNWGVFLSRLDIGASTAAARRILAVTWPEQQISGSVFSTINDITAGKAKWLYSQTDYLKQTALLRCALEVPDQREIVDDVIGFCRSQGASVCDLTASKAQPC